MFAPENFGSPGVRHIEVGRSTLRNLFYPSSAHLIDLGCMELLLQDRAQRLIDPDDEKRTPTHPQTLSKHNMFIVLQVEGPGFDRP